MTIAVISSSVRDGRLSHRVALFMKSYLESRGCTVELLDLKAYNFPLFTERNGLLREPPAGTADFTERFVRADGVVIVSPVYNADYPAALKNVVDFYVREWSMKPVGVVSVTYGKVPGIATVQKIQTLVMKLDALAIPALCTMIEAGTNFTEDGTPVDAPAMEKLAKPMVDELLHLAALSLRAT